MNTISRFLLKHPEMVLQVAATPGNSANDLQLTAQIIGPNEARPGEGRVYASYTAHDIFSALNGLSTLVIL